MTTPAELEPEALRAMVTNALQAYELAQASRLRVEKVAETEFLDRIRTLQAEKQAKLQRLEVERSKVQASGIAEAEQERTGQLLRIIEQVEQAAHGLLEKAGLAHIAGASLGLDEPVVSLRHDEHTVATAFANAHIALADLRVVLFRLACASAADGLWEQTQYLISHLLTDQETPFYADVLTLLCEVHYQLGLKAGEVKDWVAMADHLRKIWNIKPDYLDTSEWSERFPLDPWCIGLIQCLGTLAYSNPSFLVYPQTKIAFSQDNQLLASAGLGNLTLWDVAGRKELKSVQLTLSGYVITSILELQLLNNNILGGVLRCHSSSYSGSIYYRRFMWDTKGSYISFGNNPGWEDPRLLPSYGGLYAAVADPDGRNVIIRDQSGDILVTLPHPCQVYDVAFASNGGVLATAGSDGIIRLWGPSQSGDVLTTLPHPRMTKRRSQSNDNKSGT
jgi:hypothetical protein